MLCFKKSEKRCQVSVGAKWVELSKEFLHAELGYEQPFYEC